MGARRRRLRGRMLPVGISRDSFRTRREVGRDDWRPHIELAVQRDPHTHTHSSFISQQQLYFRAVFFMHLIRMRISSDTALNSYTIRKPQDSKILWCIVYLFGARGWKQFLGRVLGRSKFSEQILMFLIEASFRNRSRE